MSDNNSATSSDGNCDSVTSNSDTSVSSRVSTCNNSDTSDNSTDRWLCKNCWNGFMKGRGKTIHLNKNPECRQFEADRIAARKTKKCKKERRKKRCKKRSHRKTSQVPQHHEHNNNPDFPEEYTIPDADDNSTSSLDSSNTPPDLDLNFEHSSDQHEFSECSSDNESLESLSTNVNLPTVETTTHEQVSVDDLPFNHSPDVISQLLQWHSDYKASGHGKFFFTNLLQAQIELMSLLHDAHAPLYLIQSIWEWARKCRLNEVDFFQPCSRDQVLKDLKERYGQTGICSPKCVTTMLPMVQRPATVVKFDFLEQMYSLLCDDDLMQDDNLLFRDNSPLNPPPETILPNQHLQDINDGQLFKMAHKNHVVDPSQDVLCPIILFIDKTHCDTHARLTLEPVSFTLGIFNKSTRRRSISWRSLGYVVNFRGYNHQDAVEKSTDYHHLLSIMIQSLKDAQSKNGIAWRLPYRGKIFNVVFKIPVLHILGDTLGHDDLCCHLTNGHVNYLCRYCDCPRIGCGIPVSWQNSGFKYTKQSQIERLFENQDEEYMKHISYRPVKNAFWGIIFCDHVRGLHGSLPGELLHVFQHGLFQYLRDAIIKSKKIIKLSTKRSLEANEEEPSEGTKGKKPKTKKKKRTHGYDPREDVMTVPSLQGAEIENQEMKDSAKKKSTVSPRIQALRDKIQPPDNSLSENIFARDGCFAEYLAKDGYANIHRNYVFGGDDYKELSRQSWLYGRMLQHQSDREFERSYFPSGVGTTAAVMGHEERSMLLLFLILFCNKYGEDHVAPAMSEPRASLFILVLSHSLMLESYLRLDTSPKKIALDFKDYIPIFQAIFKQAIQRIEGEGVNIIKFHLLMHLSADILRHGPATCVDSSFGESHHKDEKALGLITQRNAVNYEKQVALQKEATTLLKRAQREISSQLPDQVAASADSVISGGIKYYVTEDGIVVKPKRESRFNRARYLAPFVNPLLQDMTTKILVDVVLPIVEEERIEMPTFCKVGGVLFRADPCAITKYDRGRHDWVDIRWDDDDGGCVPGRIICFLKIKSLNDVPGHEVIREHVHSPGLYAVIASLEQGLYDKPHDEQYDNFRVHQSTSLLYWGQVCMVRDNHGQDKHPDLYIVKVTSDTFGSPIIAIPYDIDDTRLEQDWLFIEPRHQWMTIFQACITELKEAVYS